MTAIPRVVSTSALAALVLATVWLFWPSGLGGGTTYVSTHGVSMEPRFHTGDLALLSPADGYAIGDIVAYHSEALHTIVMHRIVAGDASGFVTQGDNNSWRDQDRPTEDQILGRLFVRIPHGGAVLGALRSPGVLLSLAAVLSAVLGALHDPRGRRTRRWLRHRVAGRSPARAHTMSTRGRARQVALGAGAVTLASAAGCVVLLAMPSSQTRTSTLSVTEQSQFSYSGRAEAGTTYPTGAITTGDTVWNRLAHSLTVSAATTVTGQGLTGVTGSVHLDVVVGAADGWSAVLTSGGAVSFQQGAATAAVTVDAHQAAELLKRHFAETGVPGGPATLTVTPVSEATGTVRGMAVTPVAPAGFRFALDDKSLTPAATDAAALAASAVTPVKVRELAPRTLTVLSASVPIAVARKITGAVLLLSLLALGVGAWIGRIGRGDVSDRFLVRHADRIVPVASFSPGATVIDVADAESLHRVAQRFDALVLHQAGPDEDVFAVQDVDATYRFVVPGGREARSRPPVPAPKRVPVADDATAPLGVIGKTPLTSVSTGLWGRVA